MSWHCATAGVALGHNDRHQRERDLRCSPRSAALAGLPGGGRGPDPCRHCGPARSPQLEMVGGRPRPSIPDSRHIGPRLGACRCRSSRVMTRSLSSDCGLTHGGGMRSIITAVTGGAVALAAFQLSRIDDGLVGSASLILAIFIAAISAGVLVAAAINTWFDKAGGIALARGRTRRTWHRRHETSGAIACGTCRQKMVRLEAIWVCERCDGVPANRL